MFKTISNESPRSRHILEIKNVEMNLIENTFLGEMVFSSI